MRNWRGLLQRLNYILVPRPSRMGWVNRFLFGLMRQRVTFAGRVVLVCLFVLGPMALTVSRRAPLFVYVLFLFCLIAFSRVAQLFFKPRVTVARTLPPRAPRGMPVEVCAHVTNKRYLPAFDLTLSEQITHSAMRPDEEPEYVRYLPGRTACQINYRFTPMSRGLYEFPGPVALSAFPFGMYHQSQRVHQSQQMHVYPAYHGLDRLALPVGRKHQPGGVEFVSQIGDSEEFHGNREYRPGDPLRDLDHRAWARVGEPIVKEYRQEYLCRVALTVDTCTRQKPFYQDLEAALSLTASIADYLCRDNLIVDLFAAGPDLYYLQAGRSLASLEQILDILSCIEPSKKASFDRLAPEILTQSEEMSAIIMVLLDWDRDRQQFVEQLGQSGLLPRVFVVREGETTIPLDGASTGAGPIEHLTPEMINDGIDAL